MSQNKPKFTKSLRIVYFVYVLAKTTVRKKSLKNSGTLKNQLSYSKSKITLTKHIARLYKITRKHVQSDVWSLRGGYHYDWIDDLERRLAGLKIAPEGGALGRVSRTLVPQRRPVLQLLQVLDTLFCLGYMEVIYNITSVVFLPEIVFWPKHSHWKNISTARFINAVNTFIKVIQTWFVVEKR